METFLTIIGVVMVFILGIVYGAILSGTEMDYREALCIEANYDGTSTVGGTDYCYKVAGDEMVLVEFAMPEFELGE